MVTPSWLARRLTMTAEIYQRSADPAADEYGNTVYVDTWIANSQCLLQRLTGTEIQDGRAALGTYLLTLPAGMDGFIDSFSMVIVDGQSYEVVDVAAGLRSLIGIDVHHVEVYVQRSTA